MRSFVPTALLLVAAFALAGCASKGPDAPDSASTGSSSSGQPAGVSGGAAAPGSSGPNHPPTANLGVTVPPTGSNVTFTVNGADADHDALTWTLDFGDKSGSFQGTTLPRMLNHTYAAGSYTVNLTVSDGQASAHAVVAVTMEKRVAQAVDGTFTVGSEGCAAAGYDKAGSDPGSALGGTTNGVTRVQFAVEPSSIGLPYKADFTFDTGYLYVSVDFYGSGGALLSSDNTGQSPAFGAAAMAGTVPDAAATAVLFACGGPAMASVHYEA